MNIETVGLLVIVLFLLKTDIIKIAIAIFAILAILYFTGNGGGNILSHILTSSVINNTTGGLP